MFFAVTQLTPQITRWRILSPEATTKRVQKLTKHGQTPGLLHWPDTTRPISLTCWPEDSVPTLTGRYHGIVALHRARLVLGWVTAFGQVNCLIT